MSVNDFLGYQIYEAPPVEELARLLAAGELVLGLPSESLVRDLAPRPFPKIRQGQRKAEMRRRGLR